MTLGLVRVVEERPLHPAVGRRECVGCAGGSDRMFAGG